MGTGAIIKAILKEQKKTIKQLAAESGVSLNTLYSITKRDSSAVTYPVLKKVAAALGVPIENLLPDDSREKALSMAKYMTERFSKEYNNPNSSDYHSPKIEKLTSYKVNLENEINLQIEGMSLDQEKEAQKRADKIFVSVMNGLPDSYIKERILESFDYLNRRGKIEAMIRLDELCENPRFQPEFNPDLESKNCDK